MGDFQKSIHLEDMYTGDNNGEPMPDELMIPIKVEKDDRIEYYLDVDRAKVYKCLEGKMAPRVCRYLAKDLEGFKDTYGRDIKEIIKDKTDILCPDISFAKVAQLLIDYANKKERQIRKNWRKVKCVVKMVGLCNRHVIKK
jgi:hypothetical protein